MKRMIGGDAEALEGTGSGAAVPEAARRPLRELMDDRRAGIRPFTTFAPA
jgi:hypothetical protein